MKYPYKPLAERTPDTQYLERLKFILKHGEWRRDTLQGVGALTCFGTLPQMVFDLANGVPLITERKAPWKNAVAEITAFINGARTIEEIQSYGCTFWNTYAGKGTIFGLAPNDLGPGSYGGVFAAYERADGSTLNQIVRVARYLKKYPNRRTHVVTSWRADYAIGDEGERKVVVAPCHGNMHFNVLDGRLDLIMNQRSGDLPLGVPSNMIQYTALLLMMCQVTGYRPGKYIHGFLGDIHIYEDQMEAVEEILRREPRAFPVMRLSPDAECTFSKAEDILAFRLKDFSIEEYEPHPAVKVPYAP